MPASWQTFTHAARHCSSVPYCCSNSASVSPCMIARIDPISCPSESILHRFRGGRKGGRLVDKRVSQSPLLCALHCVDQPCVGALDGLSAHADGTKDGPLLYRQHTAACVPPASDQPP